MTPTSHIIHLPDADATAALATHLGATLAAGDVILLSGPVGSGKTHFARALIQSILIQPEDVPSPTFTLVQTYETTRGLLWHTDLYRITVDTEIDELGLLEAFDEAICLVEWPDRLGPVRPLNALSIDLVPDGDERNATLSWTDPRWADIVAKVAERA
jgi:tRNA threonylcarbamoyladenosine biosynthesis protein TsaE